MEFEKKVFGESVVAWIDAVVTKKIPGHVCYKTLNIFLFTQIKH